MYLRIARPGLFCASGHLDTAIVCTSNHLRERPPAGSDGLCRPWLGGRWGVVVICTTTESSPAPEPTPAKGLKEEGRGTSLREAGIVALGEEQPTSELECQPAIRNHGSVGECGSGCDSGRSASSSSKIGGIAGKKQSHDVTLRRVICSFAGLMIKSKSHSCSLPDI